ncbi:hypothetical protein [uncultured Reyranella sp.]|uniref:hypothetical protein n=1 Tax=uncultured Reyranella sp. TaxID=735512 RepID=UPI0025CCFEE6|nr:hypothetical protein [uncultured Reyranella sp.]
MGEPIALAQETAQLDLGITSALAPMIAGKKLIAAKTYYAYVIDEGGYEVGVVNLGSTEETRNALIVAVFAEAVVSYPEMAERLGFVRKPMATVN